MKQTLWIAISICFLVLLVVPAWAQHKLSDIRMIEIEDFEATPPDDVKFPIYINTRVYYRVDTVINSGDDYTVWIRTMVEMYKPNSYWNKEKVKSKQEKRMLKHEQGHFYLAHIAANEIEKEMPTFIFTANWKEEVAKEYQELTRKYGARDAQYDQETRHGNDAVAQEGWNRWIKENLE